MATKILKVKQLVSAGDKLYARVEDESVWVLEHNEWIELPAIEVEEGSGEEES